MVIASEHLFWDHSTILNTIMVYNIQQAVSKEAFKWPLEVPEATFEWSQEPIWGLKKP